MSNLKIADIVKKYPIGDGLAEFRCTLNTTLESTGIYYFPDSQEDIARFQASSGNNLYTPPWYPSNIE